VAMFHRRRRCNRKVLGNRPFKEGIHILLEVVHMAFTWVRQAPIMTLTTQDQFPSKFNAMR
jgi:hypothetical protein